MADAKVEFQVDYDTSKAKKSVNSFGSSLKNLAGVAAAAFSVKKIADFANESINAYNAQIEAETKLEEVMTKRIGATEEQIEETKKLAREQQKIGIFGDELIIQGQQQLATFASTTKTVNLLTPAMNNLIAQQKGVNASSGDFVNIANLMGKALQGQVGALTRVGISFDEAQEQVLKYGNEEERAAVLAQVITDNVGDMNIALANTEAGKIAQATNAISDMKEEIGQMIIPLKVGFYEFLQNQLVPYILNTFIPALKDTGKGIMEMADDVDGAGWDVLELGKSFGTAAGMIWLATKGPVGMIAAVALAAVSLKDDFALITDELEKQGGAWKVWSEEVERYVDKVVGKTKKRWNNLLGWISGKSSLVGSDLGFNPTTSTPKGRGFANGGQPPVGKASMVGERGAELFVPSSQGTIIPNRNLGGGQTVVNNYPTFKIGSQDFEVYMTNLVTKVVKQGGGLI